MRRVPLDPRRRATLCTTCSGRGRAWTSEIRTLHVVRPERDLLVTCWACGGTGRASATNRGVSAEAARTAAILALLPVFGTADFGALSADTREAVIEWMADHPELPEVQETLERVVRSVGLPPEDVPHLLRRKPSADSTDGDGAGPRAGARAVPGCSP